MNGKSQAIRLPKEFRFNTKEVSIMHFGDGILIQPKKSWREIFDSLEPTDDFFPNGREEFIFTEREKFE